MFDVYCDIKALEEDINNLQNINDKGKLFKRLGQFIILSQRLNNMIEERYITLFLEYLFKEDYYIYTDGITKILRAYPEFKDNCIIHLNELLKNNEFKINQVKHQFWINGFDLSFSKRYEVTDILGLPYPYKDNKPYINCVYVEVTNHCNQKCSFCPDPKRIGSRENMDFEDFKKSVTEIYNNFNIGYWQLNAYGEPLLNPNIFEMTDFIRKKLKSSAPVYYTSHGLTLTDNRLEKLLKSLPSEIMISLHNDSNESYEKSRSLKIGNYDLLKSRIEKLLVSLISESLSCSIRLSVLVNNKNSDKRVNEKILEPFTDNSDRFYKLILDWQNSLKKHCENNSDVEFPELTYEYVTNIFDSCTSGPDYMIIIAKWKDKEGNEKIIFFSPRPVGSYANLLFYQENKDSVLKYEVSEGSCWFSNNPSLTIFSNGKLGLCCLDLERTANFGSIEESNSILEILKSNKCHKMFANLSFGISDCLGCSVCLGKYSK